MLQIAKRYVSIVDSVNYRIGRIMMYFIFVMIGVLLWSSILKNALPIILQTPKMTMFSAKTAVSHKKLGGIYAKTQTRR
jgi:hypothetical protein